MKKRGFIEKNICFLPAAVLIAAIVAIVIVAIVAHVAIGAIAAIVAIFVAHLLPPISSSIVFFPAPDEGGRAHPKGAHRLPLVRRLVHPFWRGEIVRDAGPICSIHGRWGAT